MKSHWQYLKYIVRHKWYVFQECRKLGIIWRGITHDLSKFRLDEWLPYLRKFYGTWPKQTELNVYEKTYIWPRTQEDVDMDFDRAWLRHIHRNSHHWQYWLYVGIDNITGRYYNASDKRRVCQCQSFNARNEKSAQSADLNGHVPTFSMGDRLDDFAKSIMLFLPRSIKKNISKISVVGTENEMPKIRRNIGNGRKTSWYDAVGRYWNIMVEPLQNVIVAAMNIMSFYHLIILTVMEQNGGGFIQEEWADFTHTDGSSKIVSRQDSVSYATTVTCPTDFIVTVPIRKTSILAYDDGSIKCLACSQILPNLALLPLCMPYDDTLEMIADWRGAGKAQGKGDNTIAWYKENKHNIKVNDQTRYTVERLLYGEAK